MTLHPDSPATTLKYSPSAAWDLASMTKDPYKTYSRLRGVPEGHPISEWASAQVNVSIERSLTQALEEMIGQVLDQRLY